MYHEYMKRMDRVDKLNAIEIGGEDKMAWRVNCDIQRLFLMIIDQMICGVRGLRFISEPFTERLQYDDENNAISYDEM